MGLYKVSVSTPYECGKNHDFSEVDREKVFSFCNKWLDGRYAKMASQTYTSIKIVVVHDNLRLSLCKGKFYEALFNGQAIRIRQTNRLGLAFASAEKAIACTQRGKYVNNKVALPIVKLSAAESRVAVGAAERFVTGGALAAAVASRAKYRVRNSFSCVADFLLKPVKSKILVLYGLRRTGKTELIWQGIGYLLANRIESREVAFYQALSDDHMDGIVRGIDRLIASGVKYVFIDEVTDAQGFLAYAGYLADRFAPRNVHIVVAGTSSLLFRIAWDRKLYDRCIAVHTTRVSYAEYTRLLGNVSVVDYLRGGGVFGVSDFEGYVKSVVVENVYNSLRSYVYDGDFLEVHRWVSNANFNRIINSAISGVLKAPHFRDLETAIRIPSLAHAKIESVVSLLDKKFNFIEAVYGNLRVRYSANATKGIDKFFDEEYSDADSSRDFYRGVIDVLSTLDFLAYSKLKTYTARTHELVETMGVAVVQCGISYSYTQQAMDEIRAYLSGQGGAVESEIAEVVSAVETLSLSWLFETEVSRACDEQYSGEHEVFKFVYSGDSRRELDVVIYDTANEGVHLLDAKFSVNVNPSRQCATLCEPEVSTYVDRRWGKVLSRNIVYLGETLMINSKGAAVKYWNAEEFLTSGIKALSS